MTQSSDPSILELIASLNGIQQELRELRGLVSQSAELNQKLDRLLSVLEVAPAAVATAEAPSVQVAAPPMGHRHAPEAIHEFLALRGIQVVGCKYDSAQSGAYSHDSLAKIMGEKYSEVAPFLIQLKAKTTTGEEFLLSLKDKPQKILVSATALGNLLFKEGFLATYTYHKAPKCEIVASPARTSEAINFINGEWLEQYTRIKFNQILAGSGQPYSFMQSVKVKCAGGEAHEFDFLGEIAGHIIWIECKTGDYRNYLASYAALQRAMWLPKEAAWLVLADARLSDTNKRHELEQKFSMKVISISELAGHIESLAAKEY